MATQAYTPQAPPPLTLEPWALGPEFFCVCLGLGTPHPVCTQPCLHRAPQLVSQSPVLFCTTILDNISFGVRSASFADVVSAAQQAHAHDFIMGFPDGWVHERAHLKSTIVRCALPAPSVLQP